MSTPIVAPQTNPTITGLQNMVANDPRLAGATNPSTQWAGYDSMPILERNQLVRDVQNAKSYQREFAKANWITVLAPEFLSAIEIEVNDDIAEKKRLARESDNNTRININEQWNRREASGHRFNNEQPTDHWGKSIGQKAYKWLRNFKSNNGNWYAEYQPVRGGDNRKYYSISFADWRDDYMIRAFCNNGHSFHTMTPIHDEYNRTTCPNCGDANIRTRL